MEKEIIKRDSRFQNEIETDLFLVCLLFYFFLIINPLYLLLIFVLLERWRRLPGFINYFFVVSFSLMFINREIGNSWDSGDAYANDDVVNYLEYYRNIFDVDFFKGIGVTVYSGGEPLWFLMAGAVNFLTNSNVLSLIVVSVFIPILLLHKVFSSISRDFCFNASFFFTFFPEINHVFYHLWRYSLSLVLVLAVYVYFLTKNKIHFKLFFLSLFSHVSSLFSLLFIYFSSFFVNPFITKGILNKFLFILLILFIFFFFSFLTLNSLEYIEFNKFVFYVNSEEIVTLFTYSKRHYLYILISTILFLLSSRKVSLVISIVGIILLVFPFFYTVSLIYERILLLIIPIVIIGFLYEIKNFSRLKNILLLPMFLISIDFMIKSENKLFYAFMSNGHNFNIFNGIGINLFDLFTR